MVEWRFCGRFGVMRQNAITGKFSWIDEAEARRRYDDPSKELTVVPPVDEATGIVPYYIVVTTSPQPSFTVFVQQPPGVVSAEGWFRNVGGRLFLRETNVYEWPSVEEIKAMNVVDPDWLTRVAHMNDEDGTGEMRIVEKGSKEVTVAQRTFDPAPLYRPVPTWGNWDELLQPTPEPSESGR